MSDRPTTYYSHTPWDGYTPREKKRKVLLAVCPQAACRRAKACIRATDGLYCQRTHLNASEIRRTAKPAPVAALPRHSFQLSPRSSLKQVEALRILTDHLLEEAEARTAEMTARWKRGDFDHLYGKYSARGALMQPPPLAYMDLR